MSQKKKSAKTYDQILEAALDIVREEGTHKLTIDAVAKAAGISKGGVLHHFSTKEALISGTVRYGVADLYCELKQHEAVDGSQSVLLKLVGFAEELYRDKKGFPRSVLITTSENAEANQSASEFVGQLLKEMSSETSPARAEMVFFAVFGLLVAQSFNLAELSSEDTKNMFRQLTSFALEGKDTPHAE